MASGALAGQVEQRTVRLGQGNVRYVDVGEGPVLLFVHGIFVNGVLWSEMIARLSDRFRLVIPDLPLGGHREAMEPEADLSPPGIARLIADFAAALELDDVTLIGNDTGGALCQLVVADEPAWVSRLVLTTCDAFEVFPPAVLRPLTLAPHLPGALAGLARVLRLRPVRRAFVATVSKRPPSDAVLDTALRPFVEKADVRRDVAKFLAGTSRRQTLQAASAFGRFDRPVLIVWGERDLFFPIRLAERLRQSFPQARLVRVRDTRTFIPLDQPDLLARLVGEFAAARA